MSVPTYAREQYSKIHLHKVYQIILYKMNVVIYELLQYLR